MRIPFIPVLAGILFGSFTSGPGLKKAEELAFKKSILSWLRLHEKTGDPHEPARVRYADKSVNLEGRDIRSDEANRPIFEMRIDRTFRADLDGDKTPDWVVEYVMEIIGSGSGAEVGWAAIPGKPSKKGAFGVVHFGSHLGPSEKIHKIVNGEIQVRCRHENTSETYFNRSYKVKKGFLVLIKT